jgi:hypothetical protein
MISSPSFTSSCEKLSSAASFEQRVAGANGAHVTLEQRQIIGLRLREQQIEKPPTRARRALDQLQIFRAKDHRPQHAEVIREFFHRLAIQREFAFAHRPEHFDFVFALADDFSADKIAALFVPDHLRATDAAERAQGGHEINRFEDVRLALRVVAEQEMETGREIRVQPRVIAKIPEPQMSQMHAKKIIGNETAAKREILDCKQALCIRFNTNKIPAHESPKICLAVVCRLQVVDAFSFGPKQRCHR